MTNSDKVNGISDVGGNTSLGLELSIASRETVGKVSVEFSIVSGNTSIVGNSSIIGPNNISDSISVLDVVSIELLLPGKLSRVQNT